MGPKLKFLIPNFQQMFILQAFAHWLYKDLWHQAGKNADCINSHTNSYPKEELNGKTSFQLLEFFISDMAQKLYDYGLSPIEPDHVTLKPKILKD